MERTLFGFIWRYSKRQQIIILAMTVVSFPILYMTLELPKWIVNDAISGTNFPKTIFGFELDQIPYLVTLCLIFLGLVVLNNVVKYALNMTKGISGERMLRRLRYMLYHSIGQYPGKAQDMAQALTAFAAIFGSNAALIGTDCG